MHTDKRISIIDKKYIYEEASFTTLSDLMDFC